MDLKKIRKNAKHRVRQNYFKNVIVLFICTFLLTGGTTFKSPNILDIEISNERAVQALTFYKNHNKNQTVGQVLDSLIDEQSRESEIANKIDKGIASKVVNEIAANRSMIANFVKGGINAISGKVPTAVVGFVLAFAFLLFHTLVLSAVEVGRNRYFLEQRKYANTPADRFLFPYRKRRGVHVSLVILAKNCMLTLWSLTIVGYFVKYYEYSMIPYVLAENPDIKTRDAFRLSKELTYGHKFQIFKVSLIIIAWHLLGLITFNLSNIFFTNPYEFCLFSEIYAELRKSKRKSLTNANLLNDAKLFPREAKTDVYPNALDYGHLVDEGAKRHYTPSTYVLLFFSFCFVGWLYEVALYLFSEGRFVNRGTMYGPWLPIYGTGGVAILFILQKFRKNPWLMFASSFVLCGVVEYFGGWYSETFLHAAYWDYSQYAFNLHGRICLESLLVFGIGGCGFAYIFAPTLDNLFRRLDKRTKYILCAVLIAAFATDFVYCRIAGPNSGDGISSVKSVPATND